MSIGEIAIDMEIAAELILSRAILYLYKIGQLPHIEQFRNNVYYAFW